MKKTIIISDLHLNIFVNKKHFQTLKSVFDSADKIILNGDIFDDYWDYQKVAKKWQELLDILKKKEVVYIFGNHDLKSKKLLQVINTFADTFVENYKLQVKEKELIIMHGHTISPSLDKFLYREPKDVFAHLKRFCVFLLWKFFYPLRFLFMSLGGFFGKLFVRLESKKQHNLLKEYARNFLEKDQILVCGHSHYAEFNPEQHFINLGASCYENISYLLIENDECKLCYR